MKNLPLSLRALSVAVLPYLLHAHVTFSGGAPHVELPPLTDLSPLLSNAPALASTLLTWYELVARLVPTTRNISLLAALARLLEGLVPNAAVAQPVE